MAITYSLLKHRLDRLATSLLPPDGVPPQRLTNTEEDRIRAYIFLAHAEIENFLEELGQETVLRAKRASLGGTCNPVISRLIYIQSKASGKIDEPTPASIKSACDYYDDAIISNNNGIKSINVMRLFMPLGLTHKDFETILLNNLDAFGSLRGGIAHTTAKLQQGSPPSAEKNKVDSILADLSHLDQRVRALV